MRLVYTRALKPGMLLARPVYSERGELLLNADVPLTERYIELLRDRGYGAVYTRDPSDDPFGVADVVPDRVRQPLATTLWSVLEQVQGALAPLRDRNGEIGYRTVESAAFARDIRQAVRWPELGRATADMVDELLDGPPVLGLPTTRPAQGYLVPHAIDSTAVAVQLGRRIGYKVDELRRLASGCLLHDIGMAAIDGTILDRRGRLSHEDQERVRRHTVIGYHIVKALRPTDILVQHAAYQHHERQDGRGYPRGLKGTNQVARPPERNGAGYITLDAEIVAVADIYAALSGGRPYRAALPPDHVVRVMTRMAGTHLNRELLAALLTIVPVYPVGTEIVVKDGPYRSFRGVVVRLHREALERPTIRLLYDNRRERIPPIEIDLRETLDTIGCIPLTGYLVPPSWEFRPGEFAA